MLANINGIARRLSNPNLTPHILTSAVLLLGYYVEDKPKNQALIGVAVCASFKLRRATSGAEPSQETCEFYLTWHMPRVHFRTAIFAYKRWVSSKPIDSQRRTRVVPIHLPLHLMKRHNKLRFF